MTAVRDTPPVTCCPPAHHCTDILRGHTVREVLVSHSWTKVLTILGEADRPVRAVEDHTWRDGLQGTWGWTFNVTWQLCPDWSAGSQCLYHK